MLNHSSAKQYEETSHINKLTKNKTLNVNGTSRKGISRSIKNKTRNFNGTAKTTISNAIRRRAQAVVKDRSLDTQSRALIRYALETNDPWLAELVRRADAGETIIYTVNSLKHPHPARRFKRRKD